MLFYVTREHHADTIKRLLKTLETSWTTRPDFVRTVSYETLFALGRAPIANYIFTDMDRLTGYELDTVGALAKRLVAADPTIRIGNRPNLVLGRYQLLRRLYEAGVNSFNVWRLDEERAPTAYPVFIRREHDAQGPESPLLHNEAEFRAAVAALQATGKGLAGRIAVQYVSAADGDGGHHKYGAFRFGSRIVPQHFMVTRSWVVKRHATDRQADATDEELAYVQQNPHADRLLKIFDLANIDCGRIDYCINNGRLEVFEINTNPHFPRARISDDQRMIRRRIVVDGVLEGLREMNVKNAGFGQVKFQFPRPKLQRLRTRPLKRRLKDWLAGRRWDSEFGRIDSQATD